MDYLSSMNSDTQMVDSQYTNMFHQDNESSEEYSLHSLAFESQTGYAQNDIKGQQDPNLESISEEETPFKLQAQDMMNQTKQQIQLQKQQPPINPTEERVQQLSQQLDHLENETQKAQFETKSAINPIPPMNNGYQPLPFNKGALSSQSVQFKKNMDEMLNRTEKMMDEYKGDICSYIEGQKMKFRKNVEFLKSLLIAETEMVISEEERNKIIDARMQALFKEMVNILNDYQRK